MSSVDVRFGPFGDLVLEPPEPLYLPSLDSHLLEQEAYRYTIMLPLRTSDGREVFSRRDHILPLTQLMNERFKGSTLTNSIPIPPFIGTWFSEKRGIEIERSMSILVYSAVSERADKFFSRLKEILRGLTDPPQDEILVERIDAWLLPFPSAQDR